MGLKISDMVISILLVGLFMSIFLLISGDMTDKYLQNTPNSNLSELSRYNDSLAPLKANVDQIKAKQDNVSSSSKLDVIGDYFNQGYSALKITGNSFAVIDNVSNIALANSQLGDASATFKTYIGVIIVVLIFVAILLTILVRAEV